MGYNYRVRIGYNVYYTNVWTREEAIKSILKDHPNIRRKDIISVRRGEAWG